MRPVAVTPRTSATIDFLRWFSAIMVLVYHLRINVLAEDALSFDNAGVMGTLLAALTGNGPAGVMCFFVLSGYLVGGSVIDRSVAGRFSLRGYLIDRATRLYVVLIPALILGLACDALRIWLVGPASFDTPSAYSLSTIAGNLLFLQAIVVEPAGSNLPLWSLAYEGWYYILFPLLFFAAFPGRKAADRALYGMLFLGLALAIAAFNVKPMVMFGAWLLGVAVRYAPRPIVSSRRLAWAIALAALFTNHLLRDLVRGDYFVPALGVANLLLTISHQRDASVPRHAEWHARLAAFSYSLYLVHSQVMHLCLALIGGVGTLRLEQPANAASATILIVLALGLTAFGWLFSRFTEAKTDAVRAWVNGLSGRAARSRSRPSA